VLARSPSACALLCLAACESAPVSTPADAGPPAPTAEPTLVVVELPAQSAVPRIIGASQILVTWKGADGAPAGVTRTKDAAKKRAEEALARVKKNDKPFGELAKELSDDPSAKDTFGAMGNFERYAMPTKFGDAAWALGIGDVSPVVETERGFHVIKRTK